MKVCEIILVSDEREGKILPFQQEDTALLKKHQKTIKALPDDFVLGWGFWKLTIRSSFFGLIKEIDLEKLKMPL